MNTLKTLGMAFLLHWLLHYCFIILPALAGVACPSLALNCSSPSLCSSLPLLPAIPTPPSSVSLQSLHLTVLSGQSAQFDLFVSHNCIQSLSSMFLIDVSNGICLLCNTSVFLEFCSVFKYKCKLDLSKVELYKTSTQIVLKAFQISLSEL